MARLYLDENVDPDLGEILRALGNDVTSVHELGHDGHPDKSVLEFASRNERAVVTHNRRHFLTLHRQSPDHAGIIICTFDADTSALGQRINTSLANNPVLAGQLLRVIRPSA